MDNDKTNISNIDIINKKKVKKVEKITIFNKINNQLLINIIEKLNYCKEEFIIWYINNNYYIIELCNYKNKFFKIENKQCLYINENDECSYYKRRLLSLFNQYYPC